MNDFFSKLGELFSTPEYIDSLLHGFLLTIQVVSGTSVREVVDVLDGLIPALPRNEWIKAMGKTLDTHRWLAYASTLLILFLIWSIRNKFPKDVQLKKFSWYLLVFVGLQFLSGVILARFALPPFMQTTHLVLASLLVANQFYVVLLLNKSNRY